jgi:hypothetical protein
MSNLNESYSVNLDAPKADALTDNLPMLDKDESLRFFDVTITDTEISFISPLNENIIWTYEITDNKVILSSNNITIVNNFLGEVTLKVVDKINDIDIIDFDELHYNGTHYKLSPKFLNSIYYQAVEIPADILSAGQRVTVPVEDIYNFSKAVNRVIKDDLKAETYISFKELQNKLQLENINLDKAKEIKLTPGVTSYIDNVESRDSTQILVKPDGDFIGFEALNVSVKPMVAKTIENLIPNELINEPGYIITLSEEEAEQYSGFSEIHLKSLNLQDSVDLLVNKNTFNNNQKYFSLTGTNNEYFGAKEVNLDIPLLSTEINSSLCSSFISHDTTIPTLVIDIDSGNFIDKLEIGFNKLDIELPLREISAEELHNALKNKESGIALTKDEPYVGFSVVKLPEVALTDVESQDLEIRSEDLFTIISSYIVQPWYDPETNKLATTDLFEVFGNTYNKGFYNGIKIVSLDPANLANKDNLPAIEICSSMEEVNSTLEILPELTTVRNLIVHPVKSTCLDSYAAIDLSGYYAYNYSSNESTLKIKPNGDYSMDDSYYYTGQIYDYIDNEAFNEVNIILPKGIEVGLYSDELANEMRYHKGNGGALIDFDNNHMCCSTRFSWADSCFGSYNYGYYNGTPQGIISRVDISLPSIRDIYLSSNLIKDAILTNTGALNISYTVSDYIDINNNSYTISDSYAEFVDEINIELPTSCTQELDSALINNIATQNEYNQLIITDSKIIAVNSSNSNSSTIQETGSDNQILSEVIINLQPIPFNNFMTISIADSSIHITGSAEISLTPFLGMYDSNIHCIEDLSNIYESSNCDIFEVYLCSPQIDGTITPTAIKIEQVDFNGNSITDPVIINPTTSYCSYQYFSIHVCSANLDSFYLTVLEEYHDATTREKVVYPWPESISTNFDISKPLFFRVSLVD